MAMPKVVSADGSTLSQEAFQVGTKVAHHLSFNKVGVFSHDDQASGLHVEYHASTGIAYVSGFTDYVWGVLPAPFVVRDPAQLYLRNAGATNVWINSVTQLTTLLVYTEFTTMSVVDKVVESSALAVGFDSPYLGNGALGIAAFPKATATVGYGKAYKPVATGTIEAGYVAKFLSTEIGTTSSYPPQYNVAGSTLSHGTIGTALVKCLIYSPTDTTAYTIFNGDYINVPTGSPLENIGNWHSEVYGWMASRTDEVLAALADGTFVAPDTWYEAVIAQMPLEYETYKEIKHPEPLTYDSRGDVINVTLAAFDVYRAQPIISVDIVLLGRVGAAGVNEVQAVRDYVCVFDSHHRTTHIDTTLAKTLELNGTYRFVVDRVNKKLIWKSYTKIKSANQDGTKVTVEAMLDTSGTGGTDTRRKNSCNAIFVYHANFKTDVVTALRARNKDMTSGDFKYTSKVFYKILQAIGAMK